MPYPVFQLADDGFHWVVDIGYLILYMIIFRIALRLKQRRHRKWLIPYLIDATLELLNRTVYSIHLVLRTHWSPQIYVLWDFVWDVAHCFAAYGTIVLILLIVENLKAVSRARTVAASADKPAAAAWPPPPRVE